MAVRWVDDTVGVDWDELVELYRVAPLGTKRADELRLVFGNSRYVRLAYDGDRLVGAGRALADGLECAYLADIAVHPDLQGRGLGREIVERLVDAARGHRRIILYAAPGKESFYARIGFLRMASAMALWSDPAAAIASGVLRPPDG